MKDFSRGVNYYTFGTVDIGFPEDDMVCHWCPLLGIEARLERPYCKKTGEILVNPKFSVGTNCPISFFKADEARNKEEKSNDEGAKISWEFPF